MPSEHALHSPALAAYDVQPAQAKVCTRCEHPLSPLENDLLLLAYPETTTTCPYCHDGSFRQQQPQLQSPRAWQSRAVVTTDGGAAESVGIGACATPQQSSPVFERSLHLSEEANGLVTRHPLHEQRRALAAPLVQPLDIPSSRSSSLFIDSASPVASSSSPISYLSSPLSPSQYSPVLEKRRLSTVDAMPAPDPFIDITRIRMRTQAHHCLYPGSKFEGTQKSGRNSYEVTVTIVNVDFAASHLCGYLCIRGLTDDWPELTTYFDAEIIGTRHGFLTRKWGAEDEEDMVHWGRFPAFRHVKNKLKGPLLTTDAPVDAVFMRWKERFLVPDHRVQDINGASFAGFYYVCVDFNAHAPAFPSQGPTSPVRERTDLPLAPKPDASPRRARARSTRAEAPASLDRSTSSGGARGAPVAATMSGFYFHQHSEPYQQLSLKHVPQSVSAAFEMR